MPDFAHHRQHFIAGTATPRDLLERCLERVDAREAEVQAFAAIDPAAARRAADDSAARYRAGTPLSPIDGLPVALKDIIETVDLPTGFGSPIFAGRHGGRDSAAAYALRRHALPNAAIPVVTVVGFQIGGLIGGALVTETVFAWPGVGRLLVSAVSGRDLAVVQAIVLLVAATMVTANYLVDLAYGLLDPRIRDARR